MSFILDALKKSETERQRQNTPGFADVPDGADHPPRAPRWLWVLGGLLAVNLIVLVGVMLRPDLPTTTGVTGPGETIPNDEGSERDSSFLQMVEAAKKKQPQPIAEAAEGKSPSDRPMAAAVPASIVESPETITASYVTFNELRANGTVVLPDLHLDIHVYSDEPAERFVFVNMSKYREQARLTEGPLVKEIVPEGVILEHLGNGFLLPRE